MLTPFLCELGPKIAIVRGFTIFFSELLDCNTSHKLLILIESPNIFRRKSAEKHTWHVVVIQGQIPQVYDIRSLIWYIS